MPSETTHVSAVLPAKPKAVYDAWLDAAKHSAMTGSPATSDPRAGGRFTAWDGYIEGTHLELDPPRRIVQAWRSREFPKSDADSRLFVLLDSEGKGTRVTIVHTNRARATANEFTSGGPEASIESCRSFDGATK
jgi:uncharacterized protein YndB with AHSA1/START domain